MEQRYEVRRRELLAGCEVKPELFDGIRDRLKEFVEPFAERLWRTEQKDHARQYIEGLLSDLESKNAESIAYLHGLNRKSIQHFLGESAWDHEPLIDELVRQVGAEIGEADGVLVIDPSAHGKKGDDSVGVKPQWNGRRGTIDNCQVGIYLAYASRKEHALVDERLFLPREWADDQRRRDKCGVPKEVLFVTRERVGDKVKHDYFLSNAKPKTALTELARVAKAEHRVEECFQRAKGEAGLSEYEVRTWRGWHHHHVLVFLATWFLTRHTSWGKKGDTGNNCPADQKGDFIAVA